MGSLELQFALNVPVPDNKRPCVAGTSCGVCETCIRRASLVVVQQALRAHRRRHGRGGPEKLKYEIRKALLLLGVLDEQDVDEAFKSNMELREAMYLLGKGTFKGTRHG